MSKRKLGLIGPIIQDVYKHNCTSECRGSIHMINKRGNDE
jgi:hypothetical protein